MEDVISDNTTTVNPFFIFSAFKKIEELGIVTEENKPKLLAIMEDCVKAYICTLEPKPFPNKTEGVA